MAAKARDAVRHRSVACATSSAHVHKKSDTAGLVSNNFYICTYDSIFFFILKGGKITEGRYRGFSEFIQEKQWKKIIILKLLIQQVLSHKTEIEKAPHNVGVHRTRTFSLSCEQMSC